MKSIELTQASDMALVELTRSGIADAYAELWKRHASAVLVATRYFTGFDPDDVAQETFLRVLQQIQAGRGPDTAFRAYAIMTARNIATNMARSRSSDEVTGADDSVFEANGPETRDTADKVLGNAFTRQVFSSLPTRWQEVLWYRDVEDLPVQEFSTYLGMSENATSALLKRAREGFKQAWIAANLGPQSGLSPDCQWVVEKLPQITRGKSTAATRKKLEAHFKTCTRCTILSEQSEHIHSRLALVLLPAMFGGAAATGYAAWLQTGAAAPTSAATFDVSAAMSSPSGGMASNPVGLAGSGLTKAMTLPVAVISVGALATSIAFSLGFQMDQQTLPVAEATTQASPNEQQPAREDATWGSDDAEVREDTADQASEQTDTGPDITPGAGGTPAITDDTGSGGNGAPDNVDSPEPPSGLSATPIDGIETGVYPRLAGIGAPNASIHLLITNDQGQSYEQVVTADAQGRWVYTPRSLLGQLTVTGQQAYSYQGEDAIDDEVLIGTYAVGHGLGIEVLESGAQETTIRVTGLAAPTKNQVVNVESTSLGTLASKQQATGPGEVVLIVPSARSTLGDLRFWQGDTSEGPHRVWWRRLAA